MNARTQIQAKAAPPLAFTPVQTGLLQRTCACGGTPGLTGECGECSKSKLSLQRRVAPSPHRGEGAVLPIVHEVLRSSGQLLDPAIRTFFEPRFGHDFSQVRIHTDTKAAESARAVNALAYTVGQDIAFGSGQYAPGTKAGNRLLAHELAHVVQQTGTPISVSMPQMDTMISLSHPLEREATAVADRIVAGSKVLVSSGHSAQNLQRLEADADGGAPKKDACSELESDRESFMIMVARHFVKTRINPLFSESAESVTCLTPRVCDVVYPSGLTVGVFWNPVLNRVAVGSHSGGVQQSCAFEYSCDQNGQLSFTILRCS